MPSTEQADLARRLLDDDEQVLDDILRTYGPSLLAMLGSRYQGVMCKADLEDVLSIGLFRLWKSRHRFDRNKSSLKVWFFRILESATRDVLRLGWQKARSLEVVSEFQLSQAIDHRNNGHARPASPATPSEEQLQLREIVAELPEMQRRIIIADAAARDATASSRLLATELGISDSTVRVYRKRAMDRIRDELRQRGYEVP